MTLTEIASGLYRRNASATEAAYCSALYRQLPADQQTEVDEIGRRLYRDTSQQAAA